VRRVQQTAAALQSGERGSRGLGVPGFTGCPKRCHAAHLLSCAKQSRSSLSGQASHPQVPSPATAQLSIMLQSSGKSSKMRTPPPPLPPPPRRRAVQERPASADEEGTRPPPLPPPGPASSNEGDRASLEKPNDGVNQEGMGTSTCFRTWGGARWSRAGRTEDERKTDRISYGARTGGCQLDGRALQHSAGT
jgi:hypothetical protein